jgi:hypothetical protein
MMAQMGGKGGMAEMLKQMTGNKNAQFNKGAFTKHMNSNNTRQRLLKKLEEKRNAQIAQSIREKLNADKEIKTNLEEPANIIVDDEWIQNFDEINNKAINSNNKKKKKAKKKKAKK